MTFSYEMLAVSVENAVVTIELNRPKKLNAMNALMGKELHDACRKIQAVGARAVIITGDDRVFSAGADLTEPFEGGARKPSWIEGLNLLADLPIPTVASIEGYCLGGGLLMAICCDLRIASETAVLGAPEVKRGVYFGSTGAWRMPRIIGLARTKELFFFGDHIDAATAEKWGLVNKVVPAGTARKEATEWATRLASGPTVSLRVVKHLVDKGFEVDLPEGMRMEAERSAAVTQSEDAAEGIRAFTGRRPPNFKGR